MKIPQTIIEALEEAADGLNFGVATLQVKLHDKKPVYRIITEKSFIPGRTSSGAGGSNE